MSHQITTDKRRELAHRMADGIEVQLLWSETDDAVSIVVWDHRDGEGFDLEVEREHAMQAFHHPYAYAALRRHSTAASLLAA